MNTSGDELYATSVESLSERVHRYTVSHRGGTTLLRWDEVLELWRTDRSFALFFTAMLAASPFESFFWECPASSYATLSAPFECVTIRASTFARANPANFAEHFNAGMGAATFLSLGGDATLVAPTGLVGAGLVGAGLVGAPGEARASYGHIAAFCRGASESQHLAVWQAVGAALAAHNSASGGRPVWLSTEGSGVPWLHIRMDSRPKYYHLSNFFINRAFILDGIQRTRQSTREQMIWLAGKRHEGTYVRGRRLAIARLGRRRACGMRHRDGPFSDSVVRGVDQLLRNSRPLQNTREREPRRVATLLATWAVVVSNSKRAYHVHAACTTR
jgi:hypothetical protein